MDSNFNPRSPCGERQDGDVAKAVALTFQSTLPVWGATRRAVPIIPPLLISIHAPRVGSDEDLDAMTPEERNFNPRSPCGERPGLRGVVHFQLGISIHAPRVGSDSATNLSISSGSRFQSTLPVWGATGGRAPGVPGPCDFNPRSPCGERRFGAERGILWQQFQSTLPVWGATVFITEEGLELPISIHAPRVGSDCPVPLWRR